MMGALLKLLHIKVEHEEPEDRVQMDAAKERLTQRGEELEEKFDELSKMIRRMKRSSSSNKN